MSYDLFSITGKTALITGGTSGIGLMIAEGYLRAGARIYISSRKPDACAAAQDALAEFGAVQAIPADVSTEDGCRALIDAVAERTDSLDILVNNAGATWGAPIEDYPLEAWDKVMNLNIRSLFLMSQAVGRASMIPRRQGRIINLASIAGLGGSTEVKFIAYGTSKGAVVNFTRTLAPGFFPSRMSQGILAERGADTLAAHAPLKRLGDDDDLKGAALLFASAAGKHITGQILAVDGGISAVHCGG